jgi:hypothetical protein
MLAMLATILFSGASALYAANDTGGHWAESTLSAWETRGWLVGDAAGGIRPDANITRAEFIRLVNQAQNYTEADVEKAAAFSDLNPEAWYYNDVAIALAAGYIRGISDTRMAPEQNITRQEAMTIVAQIAGFSQPVANAAIIASFTDGATVGSWARGYVSASVGEGFVSGYNNQINPLNNITRAETVTLLEKVYANERVYRYPGTYGGTEANPLSAKKVTVAASGVTLSYISAEAAEVAAAVGAGNVTLNNVKISGALALNAAEVQAALTGSSIGTLNVNQPATVTTDEATVITTTNANARLTLNGEVIEGTVTAPDDKQVEEEKKEESKTSSGGGGGGGGSSQRSYNIIFNANGGAGAMPAQTGRTSASTITLNANAFTYTGYAFTGWNTVNVGGGTAYTDGQSVSSSLSATLYAQWTPLVFTISDATPELTANKTGGGAASLDLSTLVTPTIPGTIFTITADPAGASTISGSGGSIAYTDPTLTVTDAFSGTATITFNVEAQDYTSGTITVTIKAAPVLGGTATIDGTVKIGETLTVDTTAVTGGGGAFSYQWEDGSNVVGTDPAYVIQGADVGKTITCDIERADANGSVTATASEAVPYTLKLLDIIGLAGDDRVSFDFDSDVYETTALSGSVNIQYTLDDINVTDQLTLQFQNTIEVSANTPTIGSVSYTVDAADANDGVIIITAIFVHTDATLLDAPTGVSLTDAGVITFTAGTNNVAASATYTYTLFKDAVAVAGFEDQAITSGATPVGIVDKMLAAAGSYTVRVKAHTIDTTSYTPDSLPSAASTPIKVYSVAVTIVDGDGEHDKINYGATDYFANFTGYAFEGGNVVLTATPYTTKRNVVWSGGPSTPVANVYTITSIAANAAVTATFVDKTVTPGDISAALKAGTAGTATYTVATAYIADGESAVIAWYADAAKTGTASAPTGITIAQAGATSSNSLTLDVAATDAIVAGDYYFTVTIDTVESAVVTLAVGSYELEANATYSAEKTPAGYTLTKLANTDLTAVVTEASDLKTALDQAAAAKGVASGNLTNLSFTLDSTTPTNAPTTNVTGGVILLSGDLGDITVLGAATITTNAYSVGDITGQAPTTLDLTNARPGTDIGTYTAATDSDTLTITKPAGVSDTTAPATNVYTANGTYVRVKFTYAAGSWSGWTWTPNAGNDTVVLTIKAPFVDNVLVTAPAFTDTDTGIGTLTGDFTITEPTENFANIDGYRLYWGSNATTISTVSSNAIITVPKTVAGATGTELFEFGDTAIPSDATHLLVYTCQDTDNSTNPVAFSLAGVDKNNIPDGTYTITTSAPDAADEIQYTSNTLIVAVDGTPANNLTYYNTTNLNTQAAGNFAEVAALLDGANVLPEGSQFTLDEDGVSGLTIAAPASATTVALSYSGDDIIEVTGGASSGETLTLTGTAASATIEIQDGYVNVSGVTAVGNITVSDSVTSATVTTTSNAITAYGTTLTPEEISVIEVSGSTGIEIVGGKVALSGSATQNITNTSGVISGAITVAGDNVTLTGDFGTAIITVDEVTLTPTGDVEIAVVSGDIEIASTGTSVALGGNVTQSITITSGTITGAITVTGDDVTLTGDFGTATITVDDVILTPDGDVTIAVVSGDIGITSASGAVALSGEVAQDITITSGTITGAITVTGDATLDGDFGTATITVVSGDADLSAVTGGGNVTIGGLFVLTAPVSGTLTILVDLTDVTHVSATADNSSAAELSTGVSGGDVSYNTTDGLTWTADGDLYFGPAANMSTTSPTYQLNVVNSGNVITVTDYTSGP